MGPLMQRGDLLGSRRSRPAECNAGMENDARDGKLSLLALFQKSNGMITVAIHDKLFLGRHRQEVSM